MNEPSKDGPILVAMSGGVDSSVAAALLKDQGIPVEGAYMKNWINEEDVMGDCPWQQDIEDARAVADQLDIPFRVLNFIGEYRDRIVQYLIDGYSMGFTPNPDVLCNREMKFGVLLDWALQNGFSGVATGHYARRISHKGHFRIAEGVDKNKDQSYFLCRLTPMQIAHARFPVGELKKARVRELARQWNLPNAAKKDSQGICFIGEVKMNDFLEQFIPDNPGPILSMDGHLLGQHRGLHRYTIGQRRGIGVPSNADNEFFVVVAKEVDQNALIVAFESSRPDPLWHTSIQLHKVSWMVADPPDRPTSLMVKVRYRDPSMPALWEPESPQLTSGKLTFDEPQRALAPGQIAALYDNFGLIGAGAYI